MKKQFLILVLVSILIIGMIPATLFVRNKVETKQVEKQATNDSIILLNRLLVQENQRYISVMVALDSISRKGGTLSFTNFGGKSFELNLIAK